MALVDDLITRRDAIIAELKAGKTPDGQSFRQPDYSADGESVSMVAYRLSLYQELREINTTLASLEGPWELESVGTT